MSFLPADYDALLKDQYTPEKVRELSYYENPLFGMMKKKRRGGRRYIQPVMFGHPGGASATFAKAKNNQFNSKYEDFQITRSKQFLLVTLDNELYLSAQDNLDAFEPAFDEFDKGFRGLAQKINRRLYRKASGSVGQITAGSNVGTATITLVDPADAFNIEAGMLLVASATDGGGSLRSSAATVTVSSVDYEAGTVTATGNWTAGIAAVEAGDYLFAEGDWDLCPAGLESWLPVTNRASVLAASFFGVTRSLQGQRLGGIYMDATSMGDLDETVIKLVGRVNKHGGKVDLVLMNSEVLSDLQILWNSRHFTFENIDVSIKEKVGDSTLIFSKIYSGMMAQIGGRKVKLIGDQACPSNRMYALQSDTWTIWHSYELPGFILKAATGQILRVPDDSDDVEGRVGGYFNLGCSAPGWNGVAALPTA